MHPRRSGSLLLAGVMLGVLCLPASGLDGDAPSPPPRVAISEVDAEILSMVDALSRGDDLERAQAAFGLRQYGPRSVPLLLDRLATIDPKGASWIVTLLAEHPGSSVDAALERCLDHLDERVRSSAAAALDRRGRPPRDLARKVLQRGSPSERRTAVQRISSASDPASLAALCRSLRDEDWLVRSRARRSLLDKLEEITARGDATWLVDQLLSYHSTPLPGPRTDLIAVLGHLPCSRVDEALERLLEVPDPQERQAAVGALARLPREGLVPSFLRVAAMDPVASVRREAVRALRDHGSPAVILPLVDRLRDPDGGVRAEAHGGLVRLSGVDHGPHYWTWVEWARTVAVEAGTEAISP